MLAHAFDSFSRNGDLAFASRHGRVSAVLSPGELVVAGDAATLELSREAASEATGRIILSYVREITITRSGRRSRLRRTWLSQMRAGRA